MLLNRLIRSLLGLLLVSFSAVSASADLLRLTFEGLFTQSHPVTGQAPVITPVNVPFRTMLLLDPTPGENFFVGTCTSGADLLDCAFQTTAIVPPHPVGRPVAKEMLDWYGPTFQHLASSLRDPISRTSNAGLERYLTRNPDGTLSSPRTHVTVGGATEFGLEPTDPTSPPSGFISTQFSGNSFDPFDLDRLNSRWTEEEVVSFLSGALNSRMSFDAQSDLRVGGIIWHRLSGSATLTQMCPAGRSWKLPWS